MLFHKLVEGRFQYGHYCGRIHPDCKLFSGRAFTHHAWIRDGDTIIDPTRWVFEVVAPYIYQGDAEDSDYDFGGNDLAMLLLKPCPAFDARQVLFKLTDSVRGATRGYWFGGHNVMSLHQVFWLVNLPLQILGDDAEAVYRWAIDNDLAGFIPLDNRIEILGESDSTTVG